MQGPRLALDTQGVSKTTPSAACVPSYRTLMYALALMCAFMCVCAGRSSSMLSWSCWHSYAMWRCWQLASACVRLMVSHTTRSGWAAPSWLQPSGADMCDAGAARRCSGCVCPAIVQLSKEPGCNPSMDCQHFKMSTGCFCHSSTAELSYELTTSVLLSSRLVFHAAFFVSCPAAHR